MHLSISKKIMEQIFFDSIVFGKIKVAKQEFYDAKKPIKI